MTTAIILLAFSLLIFRVDAKFNPIAFTVAQDSLKFTIAQVIPYSTTITIHNPATNITKGVFRCTKNGIYEFQVYAESHSNDRLFLEIYQNNSLAATLYGHTTADYATAGNAVILKLKVDDTVMIKSKGAYPVYLYNPGTNENTFTGVEMGSQYSSNDKRQLVAFSVVSNHHQNVAGGASVQYNTNLLDDDGSFNLSTGLFHVPSSGYYVFHFFSALNGSIARQNEELWQDLVHNGNYVCSIYAFTDYDWADAGNTVILHLMEGDTMTVRAHPTLQNNLYGSQDHIFTSFSGVQIISDSDIAMPDTDPVVIFSVGLTSNATGISNGETIKFDKIFVDNKNTYSRVTGQFVAHVTGLYEFYYHCLSAKGTYLSIQLRHNGRTVINGAHAHNKGHRASSGNSAVMELSGGETMDVSGTPSSGYNYLIGGANETFCTFSGHLLYAYGPGAIIG
ncbi:uncharacterized protein LOC128203686 isoform X2 [Mya arenaria]|uniref:uncharacterized protein LOC128203686 isoform X2 n=1 Tax=Mya arenaria TaxID=6604 RepID=UPI0022E732C9|nr:uncharacterized protein LOC128203686 isoform X2 [Mya arenaria]